MALRSTEFKVGLTVLFAVAALSWGVVWVKGYRYGEEVTGYKVYFTNAGALAAGDPVAVNGVTKGKVTNLELHQNRVLVTFELDRQINLHSDARFAIKNIGLMGERYIEIYPGLADDLLLASPVPEGRFDTGIPEVMGMMGQMISEVRDLVGHMSTSMEAAPGTFKRADSTVVDLRETARILVNLMEGNRDRINSATKDLEASASALRKTVSRNANQVDSTLDRMSVASERVVTAAAKFDSLSDQLRGLASQVENGQGTLGALLKDPSLYDDLKRAASEIDALVADIRANPKKYVKVDFSIF